MVMNVGGDINQFPVICFERNKIGVYLGRWFLFLRNFEESLFFCEFERKIVNFARVFQLWMTNIDESRESFIKGIMTWNVKQFI